MQKLWSRKPYNFELLINNIYLTSIKNTTYPYVSIHFLVAGNLLLETVFRYKLKKTTTLDTVISSALDGQLASPTIRSEWNNLIVYSIILITLYSIIKLAKINFIYQILFAESQSNNIGDLKPVCNKPWTN